MKQIKSMGLGLLVLIFTLVGLTACGGEAPPTPSPLPPTATSAPPTATTEPTTVTSSGGQTTGGKAASYVDVKMLEEAVKTTADLKSYHYTMNVDATDNEQTADVQGDFVAPDKGYVKGTLAGQTVEQLISGSDVFVKDASGKWVSREETTESTDPMKIVDPTTFASEANPVDGLNSLLEASTDWRDQGEETMNGKKVRRFSFNLDAAKMMGDTSGEMAKQTGGDLPSLGGGQIWVDTQTKYMHKLTVKLDFAFLIKMMADAMTSAFGGTPTPGGPTPTALPASDFEITMNVSKHNDPSISVPDAPAVSSPSEPTATTSSMTAPTAGSNVGMGSTDPATSAGVLNVGQTGEIDGLKVTLHSVRRTEQGALGSADEGKEYVIVKLTFENTTAEEKVVSSLLQFAVRDAAGTEYNVDLFADVKTTPDGDIAAKGKLEGESGFEVPKAAKGLVFEYTPLLSDSKLQFKLDK
ncbi:MAG: DUF4352 domain-containing protein [Chloroflexia bacterium]